ncbi:retroviral-like aspartic protease family protein [Tsuneonella mangrovi]|uniref:retroviral-like aspartic protease family protein n=1 Tax=Tsuneonella mangrovi TaxID=1982042 RepID=UPI000BA1C82B|nr:retroviral-like aspartic protease family protein [Tsuneonella mangrovi]
MAHPLAFAAGLLLAAATSGAATTERIDPGPLVQPTEPGEQVMVSAERDPYMRMTVPVTIEGQGPFQFMVDTGAQATVVTPELRDQLKLPSLGTAIVVGMASTKQVELVRLDGLKFADHVFDALHVPLLEEQHIGADGILGLDSLQDLRVLIDFRKDTIEVANAKQLGGNIGYEIIVRARRKLGRLVITDALVDGVRTSIIIDTGSQSTIANKALQRRLHSRKQREIAASDVMGAKIWGDQGTVGKITVGEMSLTNVPIMFVDAPTFAALGLANRPALVLGMENLRLFDRVAIDFAERKVLFDMPRGTEVMSHL